MTQTTTNVSEIKRVALRACDIFRGGVRASEYKNYVLVFLFLKYLSDVWKDRLEQYARELGGDMERIERRMRRERFFLPPGCDFDTIYARRDETNIGEIINIALKDIEEANKAKFEGIFRNVDFNSEANLGEPKERNHRLRRLIEHFADPRLDLRPSRLGNPDVIGNTYEYLIAHFASDAGKRTGDLYTPKEVAILMAKLLQPQSGDRICDPVCGSGSLLIRLADEVGDRNYALYGQESNGDAWALCRMNMFLHGKDSARIEWGNTLTNPKLIEGDSLIKFDVVAANPPFSLDRWDAEDALFDRFKRFYRGVPPKSKADYAYITHMIETSVERTGRVGVIAPHGVLFRGAAEGKIRQRLIEENLVEAVIGLPANLFFGTGISAVILLFNRGKPNGNVLFVDASREYGQEKNQNRLREQDIDKIVRTYLSFQSVEKYAHCATFEEIQENKFNLNISRYVKVFEEDEIDIQALENEINSLEQELHTVRAELDRHLSNSGV